MTPRALASPEARLIALGITLPTPPTPVGSYVPGVIVGNLLFMSGHGPFDSKGIPTSKGKLGQSISTEEGKKIAREVAINIADNASINVADKASHNITDTSFRL